MPRHPRIHAPGLLYHLMARGNNGQAVFVAPADYEAFLQVLQTTRERYPFSLSAYVLLPNHFHLLLEVRETPTGRLMQAVLTGQARRVNRVHQRRGQVFQGRYTAILCERDSYLVELVRYLHLNPVRAGLVQRPQDWPWSGQREYLGRAKQRVTAPGPVRGQLATPAQYAAFVREGGKGSYRVEWHPSDSAPFLGPEQFVRRVVKGRELAPLRRPPPLAVLWQEAAEQAGLSPEAWRSGGRRVRVGAGRDGFLRRAVCEAGYRAATVAAVVGCPASTVSRALQRGVVSRERC